jgi:pyruvate,water dikinase
MEVKMAGYHGWTVFEFDEEKDLAKPGEKGVGGWVIQSKDCVPALAPMEVWCWALSGNTASRVAELNPSSLMDARTKDGYCYLTAIPLEGEELKQAQAMFDKAIVPWIEDFEGMWNKWKKWLDEEFLRLKKVNLKKLEDWELASYLEDWLSYHEKGWYYHLSGLYASGHVFGAFEDMCRELLNIDEQHPTFKALLAGFELQQFKIDKGLWQLAVKAVEMGLKPTFESIKDNEEVYLKLKEMDNGRKWLEGLYEFIDEHCWRTTRVYDVSSPTWVEKPSLSFRTIRTHMAKPEAYILDEERKRLSEQREKAEAEVLPKIPEAEKETFAKLLRATRAAQIFAEDHDFCCEQHWNSLGRHMFKEIGERFAKYGTIDEPGDIYYLVPEEVLVRLGCARLGAWKTKDLMRIRKEQHKEFLKVTPPVFLGDMNWTLGALGRDQIIRRFITGIPLVKPELKASLYGSHSTAGVAEGRARVIVSESEFGSVQPGEILVAPLTTPSWIPLFQLIGGVVSNAGGSLCHTVIVSREFGIPAVIGTMEATSKIKTGQRIRVDGDNCCVYILE